MNWRPFDTTAYAKYILAGEHAVLRGYPAIALPYNELVMRVNFEPVEGKPLDVWPEPLLPVVEQLLEDIRENFRSSEWEFQLPQGNLKIESSIPYGSGLGSSAALCVSITRWVQDSWGLPDENPFEFARWLEDRFHGKSSGLDVAAVLHDRPVVYSLASGVEVLSLKNLPNFTVLDTGIRAQTKLCIHQVELLADQDVGIGREVDEAMGSASEEIVKGLSAYHNGDKELGLSSVAKGMNQGHQCFEAWGLVPEPVRDRRQRLLEDGALAVKVTGAGNGGNLVALWN